MMEGIDNSKDKRGFPSGMTAKIADINCYVALRINLRGRGWEWIFLGQCGETNGGAKVVDG